MSAMRHTIWHTRIKTFSPIADSFQEKTKGNLVEVAEVSLLIENRETRKLKTENFSEISICDFKAMCEFRKMTEKVSTLRKPLGLSSAPHKSAHPVMVMSERRKPDKKSRLHSILNLIGINPKRYRTLGVVRKAVDATALFRCSTRGNAVDAWDNHLPLWIPLLYSFRNLCTRSSYLGADRE